MNASAANYQIKIEACADGGYDARVIGPRVDRVVAYGASAKDARKRAAAWLAGHLMAAASELANPPAWR